MSGGELDGTPWLHIEHFMKLRGFLRKHAGTDAVFVKFEHLPEFCSGLADLPARMRSAAIRRIQKANVGLIDCDGRCFVMLLAELGFNVDADGAPWSELLRRVATVLDARRCVVVVDVVSSEEEAVPDVPQATEYSGAVERGRQCFREGALVTSCVTAFRLGLEPWRVPLLLVARVWRPSVVLRHLQYSVA